VTPIAAGAGNGHAISGSKGVVDLAARGYQEDEYLISGRANTYEQASNWTEDGVWPTRTTSGDNPYTTRLMVVRPTNPAKFNGTVVVEWLNVSFGVDIPVDFSQSREHFIREGYAYVGVTAQKLGADKLKSLDPARYNGVDIRHDMLSYDIFSQAAQAVRSDPRLLGGRSPSVVLASGHSQSALRLTTYTNAIQPVANVFDGVLIHGRAALAAPIGDGLTGPLSAQIRTDLRVPVFTLQSETDVITSNSVRQDTALVRTWEVAGTAHADRYGLDLYNRANARDKGVNGGAAPPKAAPIFMLFGLVIVRDSDQNALGGVRLPDLDALVGAYAPNNSGGNVAGACGLLGTTTPFSAQRILQLYPDHATYVAKFTEAANRALRGGYLVRADYDEAVARANAAKVP
jgi:alpha/beta hydrolase family protein